MRHDPAPYFGVGVEGRGKCCQRKKNFVYTCVYNCEQYRLNDLIDSNVTAALVKTQSDIFSKFSYQVSTFSASHMNEIMHMLVFVTLACVQERLLMCFMP